MVTPGEVNTSMVVPDYCEPLVGWRMWGCTSAPEKGATYPFRLTGSGIGGGVVWPLKTALESTHVFPIWGKCLSGSLCSMCGIYAAKTREQLVNIIKDHHQYFLRLFGVAMRRVIIGEVYLWGEIAEHEQGYRARFAYPKRLVYSEVGNVNVQTLAEAYNVPYEEDQSWTSVLKYDDSLPNPYNSPDPYNRLENILLSPSIRIIPRRLSWNPYPNPSSSRSANELQPATSYYTYTSLPASLQPPEREVEPMVKVGWVNPTYYYRDDDPPK